MELYEIDDILARVIDARELKDKIYFLIKENGLTVKQAVALLESAKTELFDRKLS